MDVESWLAGLRLDQYAQAFADNDVDAATLPQLTSDDLREIGVKSVGHRRKLLEAIERLGEEQESGAEQTRVLASSAPVGEQRQVTVVFADLAGFTSLSQELGAEATHDLLNRYFEAVDAIIAGYGGHVDKHMGDNVMAVFGAPIAHANDPERAVRAALDIHQAMTALSQSFGRMLKAHIGVASGQVVASGTGSRTHQEYTVTGDSVNLASRLQDKAEAGETLLSEAVHGVVSGLTQCEPLGAVEVKGLADAVNVWRLEHLRDAASHHRGRFVGRDNEKRQISALLDTCRETAKGQTVLVRGDAGIGKTRLIEEVAAMAASKGFTVHRSMFLDFGVARNQDAFHALVANLIGLDAREDEAACAATAAGAVTSGLIDADRLIFLNDLLDLPQSKDERALYDAMEIAVRNRRKQETLGEIVSGLSGQKSRLLVVEDVHWADHQALGDLAALTASIGDAAAILVLTSRVEGDPSGEIRRVGAGAAPLLTIDLGQLRRDEALEFAKSFANGLSNSAELSVERAAGNPLFLEQLLRHGDEQDGSAVPGTVQSLVQARIDRIDPVDKRALQAASVLGQRFPLEGLRYLIDDPSYDCGALAEHFLVHRHEDHIRFDHALVRDAVYDSLLKGRRTELHKRAAAWCGETELLLAAEHLDRADDPGAPAAFLVAAQAQFDDLQIGRALVTAESGLVLAEANDDRLNLGVLRAGILRQLGRARESLESFRHLLDLAEDDMDQCRVWVGVASCIRLLGGYEEGLEALDKAEPLARRHAAHRELSQIFYYRGCLMFGAGAVDACLEQHQTARDEAAEADDREWEAQALSGLGDAYYGQARMRLAMQHFEACCELCRQHGFGRIEVGSTHMIGVTRRYLHEFRQAIEDVRDTVVMAAKVGNTRTEMVAQMILGEFLIDLGDFDGAYGALERSLALVDTFDNPRYRAYALYELGRGYHHDIRHRDEAEGVLTEALRLSRETGIRFLGPRILAALALANGSGDVRRKALEEGETIVAGGCLAHVVLWFYRDAIETSLRAGAWDEAERYVEAFAAYIGSESVPWAVFFISRGRTLAAHGRGANDQTTRDELERLHDEAESVGLKMALPALESALAG